MEQKLQLCVFMLHIQASLALWQRMTVMKGQTVLISCPITNALQTNVEWKNPEGYILFFKHSNGLKSKRHRIHKLSESEFTVSISSVTFKDGGNYTCSEYSHPMTEKTVELTVLDQPKMKKTKHQGRFDIKCTAEGNHYPSQIFWKLNHGPEILAHPQVLREDKKYISSAILSIQSVENGVTVTCLVRHPNLHTRPLMDFVKVKENSKKSHNEFSSPTAQPQQSTGPQRTTSWLRYNGTTAHLATRGVNGSSQESSILNNCNLHSVGFLQ
uniref:Ig-like domain-containing protein n=1 Tax=Mola mola TaxID=94237 RepID=A0A3Q3WGC9_MOLML